MSQGNPTKVEINKYSENWVLYGDQSKAWRVAYPKSKASAEVVHNKASLMHKMDDVQVRIAELQNIRREVADETCGLNAAWVAKRLKDMSELDVLDIMEKDLRSFKPLDKWPKIWRTSISGIDLVMISNEDDNIDAIVKKIKWPDKVKNIELIGKLVDVSAFKENSNVTVIVKKSFNDFYDE